jgi:hypothetical protein
VRAMVVDELVEFLKRHRIAADELFDARNLTRAEYQVAMQRAGKLFALNADRCERGHRLRTRPGHCIMCDTSDLHHYRLWYRTAYVYIAGSRSSKALKIGTSNDPPDRIRRLNSENYGGISDWTLVMYVLTAESGRKEKEVHQALRGYFFEGKYFKNNKTTKTYELVKCSIALAQRALEAVITPEELGTLKVAQKVYLKDFEFV